MEANIKTQSVGLSLQYLIDYAALLVVHGFNALTERRDTSVTLSPS